MKLPTLHDAMTVLARLFGKRIETRNEYCHIVSYYWHGDLYYWRFDTFEPPPSNDGSK